MSIAELKKPNTIVLTGSFYPPSHHSQWDIPTRDITKKAYSFKVKRHCDVQDRRFGTQNIFFIFHMKEIQGNGQYSVTLDNVEIV